MEWLRKLLFGEGTEPTVGDIQHEAGIEDLLIPTQHLVNTVLEISSRTSSDVTEWTIKDLQQFIATCQRFEGK